MHKFRELLKSSMEIENKNDVALLFSGGTDSLTCLYSLFDRGIRPTLYTFYMEGVPSMDLDVSKKVAEHYDLSHKIVPIPQNVDALQRDVLYIVNNLPVDRKTNIQCVYPFLYVLPHVSESVVVSGICADDLFGSSKGASIKGSKDKVAFDRLRSTAFESLNSSAYLPIKTLVETVYKKKLITPYRDDEIVNYLMGFSWEQLNKPKQKQLSIDAFSDYFSELNVYRRNGSLQVVSGIRDFHKKLVDSPLNTKNRHRVDEIYRDIRG